MVQWLAGPHTHTCTHIVPLCAIKSLCLANRGKRTIWCVLIGLLHLVQNGYWLKKNEKYQYRNFRHLTPKSELLLTSFGNDSWILFVVVVWLRWDSHAGYLEHWATIQNFSLWVLEPKTNMGNLIHQEVRLHMGPFSFNNGTGWFFIMSSPALHCTAVCLCRCCCCTSYPDGDGTSDSQFSTWLCQSCLAAVTETDCSRCH